MTKEEKVLSQFLDIQEERTKQMLFGCFRIEKEVDKKEGMIALLLWMEETSSFSQFVIELPEKAIKSLKPTDKVGYYRKQPLIIASVVFNEKALKEFLTPSELFRQIRNNQIDLDLALMSLEISISDVKGGLDKHKEKHGHNRKDFGRPIM